MRVIVLLVFSALLLPCLAEDKPAPVTPAQARAFVQEQTRWLASMNEWAANQYFHTGEWDRAVALLDRMIPLDPTNINSYASAAWLLWSQGKNEQAMEYYQRLLANNPTNPLALFEVAHYNFFRLHNYEEAARLLEQAIPLGLSLDRQHLYGHALEQLHRTADALAFWKQLAAKDPKDEVAKAAVERLSTLAPEEKK